MVRRIVMMLVILVVAFLTTTLGLIVSDRPDRFPQELPGGIDFNNVMSMDYDHLPSLRTFRARDGTQLAYRTYEGKNSQDRIVVLVHGSAWHGMQFHSMAMHLIESGMGTVIVPDMRGHGENPVRRGDVDHISQLEEDMADLIDKVLQGREKSEIVLGGHSSGSGFVVRFAGGAYGTKADAFILLAPFLKYNAPTTRKNAGNWARPATRRIVGLSLLNQLGITIFNYLPVISFAMPMAVLEGPLGHTATTVYTYRMNTAFAPRSDYESDLAAIKKPMLVVAGDADESFYAERFETVISPHAKTGTYRVLQGITHLGIVSDVEAHRVIENWLLNLGNSED